MFKLTEEYITFWKTLYSMIESIITVLLIGFTAGFIFSMPIAGPISILITSNALKGNYRYCVRTALGASIVEFFYVFVAVYGITLLFSLYSPLIPYLLILGSAFLFAVSIKVFKTNLELDKITDSGNKTENNNLEERKGLRTGLIINLTNPSLFFGVLTSSFLVLSFASSVGFNTGGLDILIQENVTTISEITGEEFEEIPSADSSNISRNENYEEAKQSSFTLLLSSIYAGALASGGFLWLFLLTKLLTKYRNKIKLSILEGAIKFLGVILAGISIYLFYSAIKILIK